MGLIDIIIWGMVVISIIIFAIRLLRYYRDLKQSAKDDFLNRFNKPLGPEDSSRLGLQIRGSVRLFHSLYINDRNELEEEFKELKKLP